MRDDIQPKGLMISTTLRAVMIYQVCDLDKKILQKTYPFLQYFLVEVRGVEPLSENLLIQLSPGAECLLELFP